MNERGGKTRKAGASHPADENYSHLKLIFGSVENLILFIFSLTEKKYEGEPLSPPEGEAACGVYPLDPLFAIWLTL